MKHINNSNGAVLVIVALVIVILMGVTAFAIDLGIVFTTQKQLQNASDAGALAGARALGYYRCVDSGNPDCVTVTGVITTDNENTAVKTRAEEVVNANSAFGTPTLSIQDGDIVLGKWTATGGFDPAATPINAVKVAVQKTTEDNEQIPAFFGRILGKDGYSTERRSVAAITGLGVAPPGSLVPIGVSAAGCPVPQIRMQVTNESCVGWTTLSTEEQVNTPHMQAAIGSTSPELEVGERVYFGGGTQSPVFHAFYDLFANAPKEPDGTWKAMIPIFAEAGDCGNPNQTQKIVGFATVKISCVDWTGNNGIERPDCVPTTPAHDDIVIADMICNEVKEGRGGGADFGTLGTIPGLVE